MPRREDVEYVIVGYKDGDEIEYRDISVFEDCSDVKLEGQDGKVIGTRPVRWLTIIAHLAIAKKEAI